MKKILYVDGCVSRDTSRTEKLARAYLEKVRASGAYVLETVILEELGLAPLTGDTLHRREQWIAQGDYTNSCFLPAKRFAAAEEVVFAVPYWDLSFPAMLKVYLEHLCINGLTFRYTQEGRPVGLTQIQRVTYVTTAGGFLQYGNFGYEYVKGLMQGLFGIGSVRLLCAEGLDIQGHDPQEILARVMAELPVIER